MIHYWQVWKRAMISSFKRGSSFPALVLIGLLSTAAFFVTRSTAEEARAVPNPAVDEQAGGKTSEVAVIAGGCFWGVQGVFQHVAGVTNAVSGYTGGDKATAHYEMTSERQYGPRRIGADYLRSAQDHLRAHTAGLFLRRA